MPPQLPCRRLLGISRATAWVGLTLLVLLAGCVDAPEPVPSKHSAETGGITSVESTPHERSLPEPEPVVAAGASPSAAETPDSQGTAASPAWVSAQGPHLAESSGPPVPEPFPSEPTLAEPSPIAIKAGPGLIPGEVSPASSIPEPEPSVPALAPTSAEPTPAETVADAAAPLPAQVAEVTPSHPEANPKPLAAVRPRSLIHISPRNPKPLVNPQVATKDTTLPAGEQPAVILPPSPTADAALLSPLGERSPGGNSDASGANVKSTSLASLDPKSMRPSLPNPADPTPKPQPGTGETPVAPISISRPVSELPPEFTSLFNNKDLSGWEVYDGKSEAWQFQDGEVSCMAPGGGWLQTLTLYTDFELRFEYRLSPGGNSGVCLRFPGHGNPSLEGLEIQLLDDRADKYQSIQAQQATGSLYFVTAPKVRDAARVAGEWNQCNLRCVGNQLQVTINDQLVNEIDLGQIQSKVDSTTKKPALVRCPMGSIALQSHSTRVDFRQVGIRDLTQALESGVRWLDLQAGTGDPVPAGAKVTVHYIGFLSTGKRFANSFEKDKPVTVPLKDVIPGWREGIPGMQVGGKRRLIVPAAMAYGAKGFKEIVPPNSTLVYEIELTGFEKLAESPTAPAGDPPATAETSTTEVK